MDLQKSGHAPDSSKMSKNDGWLQKPKPVSHAKPQRRQEGQQIESQVILGVLSERMRTGEMPILNSIAHVVVAEGEFLQHTRTQLE